MANVLFPLLYGPTGRSLVIDASGRLVATGDSGVDLFVLGYGQTGRSVVVDASGRFVLSPLSTGLGTTETAANIGTGSGLVYSSKVGSQIRLRTLMSGSGISVSTSGSVIIISSTSYDDISTLQADFTNASGNWTAAISAAEGEGLDFANASGNMVAATSAAASTANGVRTDFDNASGVWTAGIAAAEGEGLDFANASGNLVSATSSASAIANGVRTDFDNASGIWVAGIAAAEGEGLDFANASGNLVSATTSAASTANNVRTDFDNASGNFAKKQDWTRITNLTNGPYTLNVVNGNLYDIDLDEDCTITFSNPNDGEKYMLLFTQASGNNTVAWEARVKWVGASAPTITAASGSMDVVSLIYNNRLNIFLADVAQDIN